MGIVEEKVEKLEQVVNERSFAYDLLVEFKALNKRMFIIILVLLGLWAGTVGGFIWYLNQYDFTSTTIEADQDGEGINIAGGGNINYGTESTDSSEISN